MKEKDNPNQLASIHSMNTLVIDLLIIANTSTNEAEPAHTAFVSILVVNE